MLLVFIFWSYLFFLPLLCMFHPLSTIRSYDSITKGWLKIHRVRRENIKSLSSSFLDYNLGWKTTAQAKFSLFLHSPWAKNRLQRRRKKTRSKRKRKKGGKWEGGREEYVTDHMWPQIPKICSLWPLMKSHFLLQDIFLTQGLNSDLLPCR